MNAFPLLPLKSETISTTIARFRAQRADKQCRPRNDRIHLGREALLTGLLLLPIKAQRGEGGVLHGGCAIYDLNILPVLNGSELP